MPTREIRNVKVPAMTIGLLLGIGLCACSEGQSSLTCADGKDNDGDGVTDCDDPDCSPFCGDDNEGDCSVGDCDGDGYTEDDGDCDDQGDDVHPDADEDCDGIDQDCDGALDEDFDGDGDGYPDGANDECAGNLAADQLDCDDLDVDINPGVEEVCGDDADNDCDGAVDENVDEDGDGHSTCDGDCDDGDPAVFPGADEVCNGEDDDCDGDVDDGLPVENYFPDGDGDGFGAEGSTPLEDCQAPSDHADNDGDCDDTDPSVHPGATEECDGEDDDCDGQIDDGLPTSWYFPDDDGDGYGASGGGVDDCAPPPGYVVNDTDCDDSEGAVNPGQAEICDDGIDNNCNGIADGIADGCGLQGSIPLSTADAKLMGEGSDDAAGISAASAGDVNGDGLDDILVGAYQYISGGPGKAYLVLGPVTGIASLAAADAVLVGENIYERAGAAVAGGGDVNGDGLDDILIGATHVNNWDGAAYLVQGPITGVVPLAAADAKIPGEEGGQVGASLALGDLDDDGHADLVVGANEEFGDYGAVYIVNGPASGVIATPSANARYHAATDSDHLGISVSAGGDVNNDGRADLLMGARFAGLQSAGTVYLDYGPHTGIESVATANASFLGESGQSYTGQSVAIVQDVNGDGFDDLLIGAPHSDAGGALAGAAYLVHGPAAGDQNLATADARMIGEAPDHRAGFSVASAGDVDGDGLGDLLVGATGYDVGGPYRGAAYLVYGPAAGDLDLSLADAKLEGEAAEDAAGYAVASAGDLDGDGYDDLLITAPSHDGAGSNAGAAYVIYGGP
jgi:hypothetical protein